MEAGADALDVEEKWNNYETSDPFDYESIMIYDSNSNTINTDKYAITRKSDGSPVWMGGNQNPGQAAVSAGDIARIAQLYPLHDEEGDAAMDHGHGGL